MYEVIGEKREATKWFTWGDDPADFASFGCVPAATADADGDCSELPPAGVWGTLTALDGRLRGFGL